MQKRKSEVKKAWIDVIGSGKMWAQWDAAFGTHKLSNPPVHSFSKLHAQ